jgi:uncharacterized protein
MFYLDASVLVAMIAFEPSQKRIRAWSDQIESGSLYISPWVTTEVSSALSIKVRTGAIAIELREAAMMTYETLVRDSLTVVSVTDAHFETAARYIDHVDIGLRGGDALHLAVSHAHSLTLATLDKRLAEAGIQLGASTLLL